MNKKQEEWKKTYIQRMVDKGVANQFAEDMFFAGEDDHDYDENPVDAADEEMRCWSD